MSDVTGNAPQGGAGEQAGEAPPLNITGADGGSQGGQPASAQANGKQSASTPALYDADATQTLLFKTKIKVKGVGTAEVVISHTLKPLTDELYKEYDVQRNVRVSNATDGLDAKSSLMTASAWLYDQLYISHEPAKLEIDDALKSGVIQDGLLAFAFVPAPTLSAEEVARLIEEGKIESASVGGDTLRLRCLFNSREMVTTHELGAPTADHVKRYNELTSRSKLVDGEALGKKETKMPSRVKPFGKIYDELLISATGYKDNKVPLHHKAEVISEHLSTEQERVEEK